ncbi:unnamed protein product [Arctogadus glacialis]
MRRCAYLCSEVSVDGNDPEVDGPKRQEARVQEEGHGLLLSPRQAMIGERAGEGVVKQKPVSKQPSYPPGNLSFPQSTADSAAQQPSADQTLEQNLHVWDRLHSAASTTSPDNTADERNGDGFLLLTHPGQDQPLTQTPPWTPPLPMAAYMSPPHLMQQMNLLTPALALLALLLQPALHLQPSLQWRPAGRSAEGSLMSPSCWNCSTLVTLCRTPVTNKSITKILSKIKVEWRCCNGHSGEWSSCPNVRAMSENILLSAASMLFTGATYRYVAYWAELLNLQLPKKETLYDIQSCYLMPAIEEAYREQEKNLVSMLRRKNLAGGEVELCGDGR